MRTLSAVLQILIIAFILYYVYVFLRGAKGARTRQLLYGIFAVAVVYALSYLCPFNELNVILNVLAPTIPIILCVIFQPELRGLFSSVGERGTGTDVLRNVVENVINAAEDLSDKRIGALIVFERTTSLEQYEITGEKVDAPVSADLLGTIFFPHTPLHDGGVILRNGRIAFAGCVFPVALSRGERRAYGTRHRAAIGLTEETDALAVVVSEETGLISVAFRGNLERGLSGDRLREFLGENLRVREDETESEN